MYNLYRLQHISIRCACGHKAVRNVWKLWNQVFTCAKQFNVVSGHQQCNLKCARVLTVKRITTTPSSESEFTGTSAQLRASQDTRCLSPTQLNDAHEEKQKTAKAVIRAQASAQTQSPCGLAAVATVSLSRRGLCSRRRRALPGRDGEFRLKPDPQPANRGQAWGSTETSHQVNQITKFNSIRGLVFRQQLKIFESATFFSRPKIVHEQSKNNFTLQRNIWPNWICFATFSFANKNIQQCRHAPNRLHRHVPTKTHVVDPERWIWKKSPCTVQNRIARFKTTEFSMLRFHWCGHTATPPLFSWWMVGYGCGVMPKSLLFEE